MDRKTTPPDEPEVPVAPRSPWTYSFFAIGLAISFGYAATAWADWEPGGTERDELPGDVRASPGGYRSYHFWHSGYHGGK